MNRFQSRVVLLSPLALVLFSPAAAMAGVDSFFDITVNQVGGPPFPSEPTEVTILSPVPGGSFANEGAILTSFSAGAAGGNPPLTITWDFSVSGNGMPASSVDYDLHYIGSTEELSMDSFFDITYRVEIQDPPGTPPGDPPIIVVSNSDFVVDSFFDIDYRVSNIGGHKAGGGGTGVGRVGGKMHLEDVALGVSLVDVQVSDFAVDSFFDITYRLAVYDPLVLDLSNEPLARMHMTAQIVPEPASAILTVIALTCSITSVRRRRRASPRTE